MFISIKKIFWNIFKSINSRLKFPELKKGETAIQLGFDMSAPITSDLFLLEKIVGSGGRVYGIDPDPRNISAAEKIIDSKKLNIVLINAAVYSEKGSMELLLGEKASWNQLQIIARDPDVKFKPETVLVEMDTLDAIIERKNIDINKIGHINITINGAEYYALKGMQKLFEKSKNISITAVAGRYDGSGLINGEPDYVVISQLLKEYGFKVGFKRIHQSFWWGFIINFIMKRKWIYGKKNYGIVMAAKGDKKIKWYQTFS